MSEKPSKQRNKISRCRLRFMEGRRAEKQSDLIVEQPYDDDGNDNAE